MLAYYMVKAISFVVCLLPRSVGEILGKLLGEIAWLFVPAKRKLLAKKQIMDCLHVEAAEAERIAKASSVRFGPMLIEVLDRKSVV